MRDRRGSVYAVVCVKNEAVKIGFTNRNPQVRADAIQLGSIEPLTLIGEVKAELRLERSLHKELSDFHIRGEWFRLTPTVKRVLRRVGFRHPLVSDELNESIALGMGVSA